MDISLVNTLKLVNCFHFQVMPLQNISRLHNLRMLLTYMVHDHLSYIHPL